MVAPTMELAEQIHKDVVRMGSNLTWLQTLFVSKVDCCVFLLCDFPLCIVSCKHTTAFTRYLLSRSLSMSLSLSLSPSLTMIALASF